MAWRVARTLWGAYHSLREDVALEGGQHVEALHLCREGVEHLEEQHTSRVDVHLQRRMHACMHGVTPLEQHINQTPPGLVSMKVVTPVPHAY